MTLDLNPWLFALGLAIVPFALLLRLLWTRSKSQEEELSDEQFFALSKEEQRAYFESIPGVVSPFAASDEAVAQLERIRQTLKQIETASLREQRPAPSHGN